MKLTLPKSSLSSALSAISPVCGRALPILSFAKLAVEPNKTWLTATDLDSRYELELKLKEQPEELGECLIPVGRVKEWLGKVDDGDVTIKATKSAVELSTPSSGTFKLNTMPSDEFPPGNTADEKTFIVGADFAPIKHITFAIVEANSGREPLEVVFIEPKDDGILCVAADGRKLATVFIKAKRDEQPWVGISLPAKYVPLVARLGECQLSESKNNLHFTADGFDIAIRKTEHFFPDWKKAAYNENFPVIGSITVIREELATAVNLCHLHKGSDDGIAVSFRKTEDGMMVSCLAEKTGNSYSNTIAGRVRGEFPDIDISSCHLEPFLSLPDETPLKIEFTGGSTVVHLTAPDIHVDAWVCPLIQKGKTEPA